MITHINDRNRERVADIYRTDKGVIGHNRYEPWVLRSRMGRKDRFALKSEAVAEAKKSWPGCTFSRT